MSPLRFINKVGRVTKKSDSYEFEFFSYGYSFDLEHKIIDDLLERIDKPNLFYIPLIKDFGTCHLQGDSVNFSTFDKKFDRNGDIIRCFSISRSNLQAVQKGEKNSYPISEKIDRTLNTIHKYSIYDAILKFLITDPEKEVSPELEKYKDSIIELMKKYRGSSSVNLDYNDEKTQNSYMLCYFPYYIENIYHILNYLDDNELQDIFTNDININLYGCGPAPDLLGLLAFINKKFPSEITDINVNFFDKSNWDYWRNICLDDFSKLFNNNLNIQSQTKEIDLLKCDNSDYLLDLLEENGKIHIFQNCITDLFIQCDNSEDKVCLIFDNFFKYVDNESIIIIVDFIGKGDSMRILNSIKNRVQIDPEIQFIEKCYNVDEFIPNFEKNNDIDKLMKECYSELHLETRKYTGFTYLILKKVDN